MNKYLIILTVLAFNLVMACEDKIDIPSLRTAMIRFLETSTTLCDRKVEEFILEKSITDIPRFRKHIVTILPKVMEEKTIVADGILKLIQEAQAKESEESVDVKGNLRALSLLEPEQDSRWFNPTSPMSSSYRLSHQQQTLFDFCSYHFFAPVKLMKVQAMQKIATTKEILSTAYLLYQAE